MPQRNYDSPRLLADIGGTYARFALETGPGRLEHKRSMRCADYGDFHAAVTAYMAELPRKHIRNAAVAIANPVADATANCEAWRRDYNEVRPHSAIGNKPPVTLIERSAEHGPRRPQQAGKSSSD